MRASPADEAVAAMASNDWLGDGGCVGASAVRATCPLPTSRLDGAPYAGKVAIARRVAAVVVETWSRARRDAEDSGRRRSFPTPGALGPPAVGTSSTYWLTAEEAGVGGLLCAEAAPAKLAPRNATKAVIRAARVLGAPLEAARSETGSTAE